MEWCILASKIKFDMHHKSICNSVGILQIDPHLIGIFVLTVHIDLLFIWQSILIDKSIGILLSQHFDWQIDMHFDLCSISKLSCISTLVRPLHERVGSS